MRRRLALLLAAALAVPTALGASAQAPARTTPVSAKIERRLTGAGDLGAFVSFRHPVGAAEVARLAKLGVVKMHAFKLVPTIAVVAPLATLERIARWSDVTRIHKNDPIVFHTDKSKHATRVDQVRAAKPKGLGLTGKGVTVAVIDSGIDVTHQDFDGQVKKMLNFEGSWVYDNPADGRFTDRAAENTGQWAGVDEHGHGTHTAGTVLGTGVSSLDDTDYSGMAPGAKLVVAKIAGTHQGSVYDIGYEINCMLAIEYLAEHPELGVKIVSNSWGVYETEPATEPIILMINAAVKRGLTFVFSAGNSGPGDETVGWPGAMGKVITVGSTQKEAADGDYAMSSFSSRGYQVDIAAPGSDIYAPRGRTQFSTGPEDLLLSVPEAGANGAFYMAISGTSMSAPHISGIAALMFQANRKLTPQLVEEILERTSVDLGDRGKDHDYGYGFVDAYKATRVASCLAGTAAKYRERCFTKYQALSAKRWRSDFSDLGDGSKTGQGSDLI